MADKMIEGMGTGIGKTAGKYLVGQIVLPKNFGWPNCPRLNYPGPNCPGHIVRWPRCPCTVRRACGLLPLQ